MIAQLKIQLEKFLDSEENWDGYGAEKPKRLAVERGKQVLDVLLAIKFTPTAVVRSAEGGVSICFIKEEGDKYADIECFNDGELHAITSDRGNKTNPDVWKVNSDQQAIKESLEKIRRFLN